MSSQHTQERQQAWADAYCAAIPQASFARIVRRHLDVAGRIFRRVFDDALVNHADSTSWVQPWLAAHDSTCRTTLETHLCSVGRFLAWLLPSGAIQGNALEFVAIRAMVAGREPPLQLPAGLHCGMLSFIQTSPFGRTGKSRQAQYEALRCFVRFVGRHPQAPRMTLEQACGESSVKQWIIQNAQDRGPAVAGHQSVHLCRLLDHLVQIHVLPANPLGQWLGRFRSGHKKDLIHMLVQEGEASCLERFGARPFFRSAWAAPMENFVALKRALGRKYVNGARRLRYFDRFLQEHGGVRLDAEIFERYLATMTHLAPRTRIDHISAARQFYAFVAREDSRAGGGELPAPRLGPARHIPYILTPEQFDLIVEALPQQCNQARHPLTPQGVVVAVKLIYAAGLRIGEAFRLTQGDVDLEQAMLLIRNTKFDKTRLVPVTASVRDMLARFARERNACLGTSAPEALFFPSLANRSVCVNEDYVRRKFIRAAESALPPDSAGRRHPRIHDLRHTFAVRRLLQWYRDGADVGNKLPLLSTYLGHVNIAATQVYITATLPLLDEASKRFERYAGDLVLNTSKESRS